MHTPTQYFTTNLGQLFSLINCYNLAHGILQEFTLLSEDTMGKLWSFIYKPSRNYKKKGSLKSMYKQ